MGQTPAKIFPPPSPFGASNTNVVSQAQAGEQAPPMAQMQGGQNSGEMQGPAAGPQFQFQGYPGGPAGGIGNPQQIGNMMQQQYPNQQMFGRSINQRQNGLI
jgi:hypothetical protein